MVPLHHPNPRGVKSLQFPPSPSLLPANSVLFNLITSLTRLFEPSSAHTKTHKTCVSSCVLSRWFFGSISIHIWVSWPFVQRPRLPAAHLHVSSSYADPPNSSHRNLAPTAHRYRAVIKSRRYHCTIYPPQPGPCSALSLSLLSAITSDWYPPPPRVHRLLFPGFQAPPPPQTAILHNYSCFRMFLSGRGPDRAPKSSHDRSLPPAAWRGLHTHAVRSAALTARQP